MSVFGTWAEAATATSKKPAAVSRRVFKHNLACNAEYILNPYLNRLSAAEFFEHSWLDIAAGDDGHVQLRLRQFLGMKDETGYRDSAAGFGHCGWIGAQILHRLADFVF